MTPIMIVGLIIVIVSLIGALLLAWSLAHAGRDSSPDDWPPTPFDD